MNALALIFRQPVPSPEVLSTRRRLRQITAFHRHGLISDQSFRIRSELFTRALHAAIERHARSVWPLH